MNNANNVLEPPLKVGSGTIVRETCDVQTKVSVNFDDVPSNLRCGSSEPQRVPTVLLKPKKTTKIATFNMRTGREDWRIHELIRHTEKQNINILAIQEHRRIHPEMVVKYEHIDNHLLVTSSAWRNASQAAVGGVGFILNSLAEKSLCEVVSLNKRILKASFSGSPESTIFSVYSPTNV